MYIHRSIISCVLARCHIIPLCWELPRNHFLLNCFDMLGDICNLVLERWVVKHIRWSLYMCTCKCIYTYIDICLKKDTQSIIFSCVIHPFFLNYAVAMLSKTENKKSHWCIWPVGFVITGLPTYIYIIYIYIYICAYVFGIYIYIYIYVFLCVGIYAHACEYTCLYVCRICMGLYIYILVE